MKVTYEAQQERPAKPNWRRVAREFTSFDAAVRYARRLLGQRPGVSVEIYRMIEDRTHRHSGRIATVRRDAFDRTWTDIEIWGEV